MSRGGPVVCFSGSIRCRTNPIVPQTNNPTAMAKAIFSGLLMTLPKASINWTVVASHGARRPRVVER
jgi:hypothetical protein